MNPDELITRLGIADSDRGWIDRWHRLGAPPQPVVLPTAAEVEPLLTRRLGADAVDAAAIAAARPDPERDPHLWWVLERCHHQLLSDMGGTGMLVWPKLSPHLGAVGRFTYLWALLSVLPQTLRYHRSRGIPEDVSWQTLSNLGEKLRLNRARFAEPGLAVAFWFTLHFRGSLYRLGRLEFALEKLTDPHPFPGHRPGEVTLGIHIPQEGGPLSPQECSASVERARGFFATHFDDLVPGDPLLTCTSWLLDPQLAERLPGTSNIAAFGSRFDVMPESPDAKLNGEKDVLLFVFNHVGPYDAARLPRDSTLRRVLADGFASGVQWQVRSGIWRG